ncbi:NAD(P)-dependent oxidoreductase [Candidatus Bipolaricaulota bacterium]
MDAKRVVVADVSNPESAKRWNEDLAGLPIDLVLIDDPEEESLRAAVHGAHILITRRRAINDVVLDAAGSNLKMLLKLGRWTFGIDTNACSQRGIRIETVPQLSCISVAEHAMTLLLMCARTMLPSHLGVVSGAYRDLGLTPAVTAERSFAFKWLPVKPFELFEKTLGIIGFGEIGMELAIRARGFGMNVIYNKRTRLEQDAEALFGVSYRSLDDLLAESDFISLHSPHTPETDRLLGRRQFEMMKSTAFVINTARGGEIDESAMVDALQHGEIAGAGLDVFVQEPLPYDHPLTRMDNVVLCPHIGGGSGTGRADQRERVRDLITHV